LIFNNGAYNFTNVTIFPTQRSYVKLNWYEETHNLHCGFACGCIGDVGPHIYI